MDERPQCLSTRLESAAGESSKSSEECSRERAHLEWVFLSLTGTMST